MRSSGSGGQQLHVLRAAFRGALELVLPSVLRCTLPAVQAYLAYALHVLALASRSPTTTLSTMQLSFVVSAVAMAILSGVSVRAETHTIRFENKLVTTPLFASWKIYSRARLQVRERNCEHMQTQDEIFRRNLSVCSPNSSRTARSSPAARTSSATDPSRPPLRES